MEIALEKINDTEALIKITLKQDDYQKSVDEKIKNYSKNAQIKGFRPGKVPTGMIKKMYGTSIVAEEVNKKLSEGLMDYIRKSDLQVLGEPVLHNDNSASIDWNTDKEFNFEFKVGFAGDFDFKIDENTNLTYHKIAVTDEVINETIENVQKQFADTAEAEEVDENTEIVVKAEAGEGKEADIKLSFDKLEEAGQKKLKSKPVGKKYKIKVGREISEEYLREAAGAQYEAIAGEEDLSVTINSILKSVPAEVNEDLFKKAFPAQEIETEEQFRGEIKKIIEENYNRENEHVFNLLTRKKLVEDTKIDLPDQFLKDWLVRTNDNLTEEVVEKEYEQYAAELKWSLIKGKLFKDHEVKIEHDDVREEAKNMIRAQFAGSGFMGEQLESNLDSFADNYLNGENGDNYQRVASEVETKKAYEIIKENATVQEKTVSREEFAELN